MKGTFLITVEAMANSMYVESADEVAMRQNGLGSSEENRTWNESEMNFLT